MQDRLPGRTLTMGVIAAGIVALGMAAGWRRASARERHRRIRGGEIGQLESLWTRVGGCRMHARASVGAVVPRAAPVVLVHGFGVSSAYFVPTAERLAVEFDVYAPDLPGHGKSDTPCEPLDIPQLADCLVAWMDAMGLRRVSLVGNSMGCQIAVDTAVRYPDRLDRLVLLGPTADPQGRTIFAQAVRLIAAAPYERLSLNAILFADYVRMGVRLIPEFRFMLRDKIEEKLPHVAVRVMLVRGGKDAIVPQRWIDEVARLVGADDVAIIPEWGHAVNYSAARQLTSAIVPFLRNADQRSSGLNCLTSPVRCP